MVLGLDMLVKVLCSGWWTTLMDMATNKKMLSVVPSSHLSLSAAKKRQVGGN